MERVQRGLHDWATEVDRGSIERIRISETNKIVSIPHEMVKKKTKEHWVMCKLIELNRVALWVKTKATLKS